VRRALCYSYSIDAFLSRVFLMTFAFPSRVVAEEAGVAGRQPKRRPTSTGVALAWDNGTWNNVDWQ